MKVFELLSFSKDALRILADAGIKTGDYRFAPLYEDYRRMVIQGDKKIYIVAVLSEKYHISERKVYDVIRRLSEECKR